MKGFCCQEIQRTFSRISSQLVRCSKKQWKRKGSSEKLISRLVPTDFDPFYAIRAWKWRLWLKVAREMEEGCSVCLSLMSGGWFGWWIEDGIRRYEEMSTKKGSWNFHDHRHTQLKFDTHFCERDFKRKTRSMFPGPVIILVFSPRQTFFLIGSVRRCSSSYTAQLTGIIPWIMIDT